MKRSKKLTIKQAWTRIAEVKTFTFGLCYEIDNLQVQKLITGAVALSMGRKVRAYRRSNNILNPYIWSIITGQSNRRKLAKAFASGKKPPTYKGYYEAI